MTREEAITLIKKLRTFHNGTYAKAIDMAIEALSADTPSGDLISRKDVLKLIGIVYGDVKMETDERIKLYSEVCELPSAETPTDQQKHQLSEETPTNAPNDLISRADAIKAVCNAQCELDVPHYPQCDQLKYCDEIQALLALPSADTVSREFYEDVVKANHGLAKENSELKEQIESADRPINGKVRYKLKKPIQYVTLEVEDNCVTHIGNDVIDSLNDTIKSADRPQGEWIPCSERMPKEPYGCFVTVMDSFFNGCDWDDMECLLPYFVGYDGESWNDADGKELQLEVLAWMPLPKPYKGGDDE